MNYPLLDINDISFSYHTKSGETPALSHISLSVSPGEFVAIVGPSGCGNAMGEQRKQIISPAPSFRPTPPAAYSFGYILSFP